MAPDKNGHPAESPPGAVNNQGLFSDYYLTALVPEDEFFRASSAGSAHSPRRRAELARQFRAQGAVAINKADLAPNLAEKIEREAGKQGLPVLGHIPYDEAAIRAQAMGQPVVEYDQGPAAQAIQALWQKLSSCPTIESYEQRARFCYSETA